MKKSLLQNQEIIEWCYQGITEMTLVDSKSRDKLSKYKNREKRWANKILKKHFKNYQFTNQWTTKLCEELVKETLIKLDYKNVRKARLIESKLRIKKYKLDWETDNYLIEVKGHSWTTPGTVGEKIFSVPIKYSELMELTGKKILIILVGYQEYEAKNEFGLGNIFSPNECNKTAKIMLQCCKKHGFEYIPFTKMLNKLGYDENIFYISNSKLK
jgi:hypothetical protein